MQQWEYLFVACQVYKDDWRPAYINGKALQNLDVAPTIYEYSNQMGKEGWELVSLDTHGEGDVTYKFRLVFKRSKP